MSYILIAKTSGDDLISPKRINIAVSEHRQNLIDLAESRRAEREEYLANSGIPWWVQCDIIKEEVIEEVLDV